MQVGSKVQLAKPKLSKTKHQLKSYSNLKLEGKIHLTMKYKDKSIEIDYYHVVKANNKIFLSGHSTRVDQKGTQHRQLPRVKDYHRYTYTLKIDPTVTPVVCS